MITWFIFVSFNELGHCRNYSLLNVFAQRLLCVLLWEFKMDSVFLAWFYQCVFILQHQFKIIFISDSRILFRNKIRHFSYIEGKNNKSIFKQIFNRLGFILEHLPITKDQNSIWWDFFLKIFVGFPLFSKLTMLFDWNWIVR